MRGSASQDRYLRDREAGASVEEAVATSAALFGEGAISATEAKLIEKAREAGDIPPSPIVIPAAGNVAPSKEQPMPKHDVPDEKPVADDPLVELAADTLRGDIRDRLLDWFKAQPKSWPFMSEREQRDLADAVDTFSYGLIRRACKIIAAGERPTIVARLVEYREKDGVEAKLKLASTGEVVAQLHEACGQDVLLVATGAEDFNGQAGDPQIDPDQRPLHGIGDEYDEAA